MAIFIPLVTKFDPKGLQGAQRALASFQNFAVDVGRVAATAITAVGVASVREAAQFETTFSRIQGLVGVTADEIGVLEEAAKRLGPAFGVSANEAGEALFFITSAGLRGAEATEVLEAALKGSAIGLGETKTIADLATSAMNAYGSANLSGTKAVDVLAEAVRLGKAEPAEFADALGMVLPIASEMGISFDQVAGSVAAMSKTGSDARIATTQLRQVMATLLSPTKGANDALADMGLSAQGLRDQIREEGLLSTLQTLKDSFGDNEEAASSVFGNIRALMGVLDLMGKNADDNAQIMRLMADDVGVLDEALEITADTSEFKFNKAMETARTSLINIGDSILEKLSPRLDDFSGWMEQNGPEIEQGFIKIFDAIEKFLTSEILADMIQAFKDMWPEIQETLESLGELVLALSPLLEGTLKRVTPMLGDVAFIMSELTGFLDDFVGGLGDVGGETPSFLSALEKQLNPMLKIRDALAQIVDLIESYKEFMAGGGTQAFNAPQVAATTGGTDIGAGLQAEITQPKRSGKTILTRPAPELPRISYFGSGDLYGRRAGGGPVAGGGSYLVGELGPEIFTPAAGGGNITPNKSLGGSTITINVNAGMGANGAQIGEQIVTAIKRYERTSGPVFASA